MAKKKPSKKIKYVEKALPPEFLVKLLWAMFVVRRVELLYKTAKIKA